MITNQGVGLYPMQTYGNVNPPGAMALAQALRSGSSNNENTSLAGQLSAKDMGTAIGTIGNMWQNSQPATDTTALMGLGANGSINGANNFGNFYTPSSPSMFTMPGATAGPSPFTMT